MLFSVFLIHKTNVYPLIPAPSAPPQNIIATPVSSTSIMVIWDDPPLTDQNGIIVSYNVTYTNVNLMQANTIGVTNRSVLLSNLEEFEEYSFEVAAVTTEMGPFSDPVSTLTYEDGKHFIN